MRDIWTETLAIVLACLVIAAAASLFILFRPTARRHRRHRRHNRRPKIDLFKAEASEAPPKVDA